ncbi:MAG: hypothetical protein OIN87_02770 [Candidatus Methanoperedens sp.]|nr:hypothetical protein [Candidatus Methanoperedens sp.]
MRSITKNAILLSVIVLIGAYLAAAVFAQPPGMGMDKDRGHARSFIEPIFMGHGFAFNGENYHILDVSAQRTKDASPGFIRSLLWDRKTHEEIRNEISNEQISNSTRGHLRFAGQEYALNITGFENNSLSGDILTLSPRGTDRTNFIPTNVGHISLSTQSYEGDMLSTGNMTLNSTEYKVMLTSPVAFKRW